MCAKISSEIHGTQMGCAVIVRYEKGAGCGGCRGVLDIWTAKVKNSVNSGERVGDLVVTVLKSERRGRH